MVLAHVRSHDGSTINDAVKEMPQRPKEHLKRSLTVLLTAPKEVWERAITLVADAFDSPFSIEEDVLGKELGMTPADVKHVMNGATFFGAMLTAHPEATPSQFVESLIEHGFIQDANRPQALNFATLVASGRSKLTEDFEKSSLRTEVLPSLRRMDTSVDVRLSFSEKKDVVAVPVVLVMIDTDADCETLWFQVSKPELKSLIHKLNAALEQVELAEDWVNERSSRTGV